MWLNSLKFLSILLIISKCTCENNDDFMEFNPQGDENDVEVYKEETPATDFDDDISKTEDNSVQDDSSREPSVALDDEFITHSQDSNAAAETPITAQVPVRDKKERPLKFTEVPMHFTRSWNNFHIELVIMLFLMSYMFNFLRGKDINSKIAQTWFESNKGILDTNFSVIGDDGTLDSNTGTLLKEYEHVYSLWCTGRSVIDGVLFELRLVNRQCLVSFVSQWFKPEGDMLQMKVFMEDSQMDGWVMALGLKRKVNQLVKDRADLSSFCSDKRGTKHSELPDSFVVMFEIAEASSLILNSQVCSVIRQYEQEIDYMYFSDQYTATKSTENDSNQTAANMQTQKVLMFSFRFMKKMSDGSIDFERYIPLMQLFLYLVDKVGRIRLSKVAKAKSEKSRKLAMELRNKSSHSLRQEAAQSRRDERRRAAKERIMAEEDPEKAKRLEEKENKKMKKKTGKMKMIKVKGM